ncbi:hypothetical protein [Bacillus atrophaeus]|uniref:hypothetical protein n=1 Tax=Bacillus atrophaeus TaxID=1452 RepID=UPI002E110523
MGEWAPFGVSLLSVLFIAVVILIKLEDPEGPVIFTQERSDWGRRSCDHRQRREVDHA